MYPIRDISVRSASLEDRSSPKQPPQTFDAPRVAQLKRRVVETKWKNNYLQQSEKGRASISLFSPEEASRKQYLEQELAKRQILLTDTIVGKEILAHNRGRYASTDRGKDRTSHLQSIIDKQDAQIRKLQIDKYNSK
mgnify:CR=1 FL=1